MALAYRGAARRQNKNPNAKKTFGLKTLLTADTNLIFMIITPLAPPPPQTTYAQEVNPIFSGAAFHYRELREVRIAQWHRLLTNQMDICYNSDSNRWAIPSDLPAQAGEIK